MKVYMSPFGYLSNRILIPVLFIIIATVILFYDVILRIVAIGFIGFLGWMIGSILDDRYILTRWKYRLQQVFARHR